MVSSTASFNNSNDDALFFRRQGRLGIFLSLLLFFSTKIEHSCALESPIEQLPTFKPQCFDEVYTGRPNFSPPVWRSFYHFETRLNWRWRGGKRRICWRTRLVYFWPRSWDIVPKLMILPKWITPSLPWKMVLRMPHLRTRWRQVRCTHTWISILARRRWTLNCGRRRGVLRKNMRNHK